MVNCLYCGLSCLDFTSFTTHLKECLRGDDKTIFFCCKDYYHFFKTIEEKKAHELICNSFNSGRIKRKVSDRVWRLIKEQIEELERILSIESVTKKNYTSGSEAKELNELEAFLTNYQYIEKEEIINEDNELSSDSNELTAQKFLIDCDNKKNTYEGLILKYKDIELSKKVYDLEFTCIKNQYFTGFTYKYIIEQKRGFEIVNTFYIDNADFISLLKHKRIGCLYQDDIYILISIFGETPQELSNIFETGNLVLLCFKKPDYILTRDLFNNKDKEDYKSKLQSEFELLNTRKQILSDSLRKKVEKEKQLKVNIENEEKRLYMQDILGLDGNYNRLTNEILRMKEEKERLKKVKEKEYNEMREEFSKMLESHINGLEYSIKAHYNKSLVFEKEKEMIEEKEKSLEEKQEAYKEKGRKKRFLKKKLKREIAVQEEYKRKIKRLKKQLKHIKTDQLPDGENNQPISNYSNICSKCEIKLKNCCLVYCCHLGIYCFKCFESNSSKLKQKSSFTCQVCDKESMRMISLNFVGNDV